jgi:putative Holliday junction resolvase
MPEALAAPQRAPAVARGGDEVVVGFDFGTQRIGVAIGNTLTVSARPLAVIAAEGDARWHRIGALVDAWRPARLVVGIPRHPDGAPHEMTARCERFARQLEGRLRLPVARVDERYSSAVVQDGRDDEAAAVILGQWLREAGASSAHAPRPHTAAAIEAPSRSPTSVGEGGGEGGDA